MRRLALLSVLVLAGCGSGGDETALLGPGEASRLDERVERVGELVATGDCTAARQALASYAQQVDALPDRRDPDLLAALRDGATELERTITADCEEPEEEPETTETTVETEPETTTTTEPEPEPTTTTVEPEPTQTVEPVPTTTTTVPPPPVEPGQGGGEDGEGGAGDEGQGGDPSSSGGVQAPGGEG